MYADGRDPLEDLISACNAFFNGSGGKVTYGGAQAGTGAGGVDGAGVITRHKDGSVTSNNGTTTSMGPDGSTVTTTVIDGNRTQVVQGKDGTTTWTGEDGDTRLQVTEKPDGTRITTTISGGDAFQAAKNPNGTEIIRHERADGSGFTLVHRPGMPPEVIVKFPDGSTEHTFDGVTVTYGPASGLSGAVAENGNTIGSGQGAGGNSAPRLEDIRTFKQGGVVTTYLDWEHADGTVTRNQLQSSIQTTTKDGVTTTTIRTWYPDGTTAERVVTYDGDRVVTTTNYADGTNITETHAWDRDVYTRMKPDGTIDGGVREANDPILMLLYRTFGVHAPEDPNEINPEYVHILRNGPNGRPEPYEYHRQFTIPDSADNATSESDTSEGKWIDRGGVVGEIYIPAATSTLSTAPAAMTTQASASDTFSVPGYTSKIEPQANVTLVGTSGKDLLVAMNGSNTLWGLEGDDMLFTGVGNDTLYGGAGNDKLSGGGSADRMEGGVGDDTYYVTEHDEVVETKDEGRDTVVSSVNISSLYAEVENLDLASKATIGTGNRLDNAITGNDLDNELKGLRGNDTLDGGKGNDILEGGDGDDMLLGVDGFWDGLTGGAGDDLYVIDGGTWNGAAWHDAVVEKAGEGTDTVRALVNISKLYAHVERLVLAGEATKGAGNDLDNTLFGNVGDNVLDGREGDDRLYGQRGNDRLLGGDGNDRLDSGDGNDALLGGAGNDVLDGGGWADRMEGGAGDDAYVVDNASDEVIEAAGAGTDKVYAAVDYTLGAQVETLVLTDGARRGTGNGLDNVLRGNGLDNSLTGGAGNDQLHGGAGNDTLNGADGSWDGLTGGEGNDLYIIDGGVWNGAAWADAVVEKAGEGTDTVRASVDYVLAAHVEKLELAGTAKVGTGNGLDNLILGTVGDNILDGGAGHDQLIGGVGNDKLLGGAGNDTLDGASGAGEADELRGGAGNDVYRVDSRSDWVVEEIGAGSDTVIASLDWSLQGTAVENLTLLGTAKAGTGNGGANVLVGNKSDNVLTGGGGLDTMTGGAGDDRFVFAGGQGGVVSDFTAGYWGSEDEVGLSVSLFADYAAVQAATAQVGADAVIAKDGFQLTLKSVLVSHLGASDFFFL